MRYYSDELKKFFNTEAELLSAEETQKQKDEEKKITKAKLAKEVDTAIANLDEAKKLYADAIEKVNELQKEYDKKVDEIMNPARKNLEDKAKERALAIQKFNSNFGPYTTTYVGNDAIKEFEELKNRVGKILDRFYW